MGDSEETKVHGSDPDTNEMSRVKSHNSTVQVPGDLFEVDNGDVNFRGVSWQGAVILVTKFQIGLGALGLPSTFHVLGFFPGVICFLLLGLICTFAGYICGTARQYYPYMYSIGDAAELLFGKTGRELIGIIYYIYVALVAGAAMLTVSVALNTLSDHGACTMVFLAVTCAATFLVGTGFRSLEKVSWISWVGVAGIIFSIWIVAIACLTQSRPAEAPATGPFDRQIHAFPETTFSTAIAAIANQLFAVGGSGIFFSISAEMKQPQLFTRSLLCGQAFIIATNIAIASIMYGKVGQYIASPALGSAGILIKKIAYGIALPGLLVTAILYSHIAAKYAFVRILRGTRHLQSSTFQHWAVWGSSNLFTIVFGFIIVSVVPFFDNFLSLVGALFNPVFTNVIPGFMLLFFIAKKPMKAVEGEGCPGLEEPTSVMDWLSGAFDAARKGWKEAAAFCIAWFMIFSGFFIIVGGTYATVLNIKLAYDDGHISGTFSCADNS